MNALDAASLVHDKFTETRGPKLARSPREMWAADKRLMKAARSISKRTLDPRLVRDCEAVIAAMKANRHRRSRGGRIRL